ncbi:hypothetical protein [uncultured Methylobacterium sp.]|uniref:hypothetical protein n=1 Tax=uncultured Methylobacterium sp. TaxID=157278 RepID=UPI0035C969F2
MTIDAVMNLLRDDRMRGFRIDVETDQIVEGDEQAEKQRRMEFVTAIGGLLGNAMKLEANPAAAALMPAVGETIMFAVRGFRAGRQLEEVFETALEKAAMLIAQPKPPQADPKMQIQMQSEQIKLQGVREKTAAEVQKAQLGIQQAQVEQQDDFARLDMERQRMMADHARETQAAARDDAYAHAQHVREMQALEAEAAALQREAPMTPAAPQGPFGA